MEEAPTPVAPILDIPEGPPPKDHLYLLAMKSRDSNFLVPDVSDTQIEATLVLPP
ncbi:hypothetical protein L484_026848 [Morus notabilis]|uniref:Uncharacterized protein n=1 Tax=Morus notabilis TaxID=981085 RepID=W9RE53_9ROSA|nr:hypothetical protein L484_026848 [Morus notabilis]